MTRQNQVSFKLTDEALLQQFKHEAKRRGISIHEYGRQMAIAGHLASDSRSEIADAMVKTNTIVLTTLRRLVKEVSPENGDGILFQSRNDAVEILAKLGINL
ncbi:hypothetical protein [Aeromonas hydrophila]|uniref:hypothetical protein n=1 Tax=Aeromonas hydrophila TaxID=644 RepID=UPI002259D014|nr:hypothetical protein [Aeromonas hydrophila]MCX4116726.1 hypothetical protein [Aeromonas hydrophila]